MVLVATGSSEAKIEALARGNKQRRSAQRVSRGEGLFFCWQNGTSGGQMAVMSLKVRATRDVCMGVGWDEVEPCQKRPLTLGTRIQSRN